MKEQFNQLMKNYLNAIEDHESAVRDFMTVPNERNSEKMAAAFEQAQILRQTLKQIISANREV